jgi:hypothetical protein
MTSVATTIDVPSKIPLWGQWVSDFARTDQPLVLLKDCVVIGETDTKNAVVIGGTTRQGTVGTNFSLPPEFQPQGMITNTLSQESLQLVRPLSGITISVAPQNLVNLTGKAAAASAIAAWFYGLSTNFDLCLSSVCGIKDTRQLVSTPRRSPIQNIENMAQNLSKLSSAAKLVIPGLREMTSAERANLQSYYKKRRLRKG